MIVFTLALLLDILTKKFIISRIIPNVGDSKKVIPNFISFIYLKNYGAAWGIFQNGRVFLSIVSILGIIILITFYVLRLLRAKGRSSILLAVTMGLLIAGALGNLIDRLAFGYVRDFINFDFIRFPIFNFADVCLTFGIILILIYIFFIYSKETPDEPIFKARKKNLSGQQSQEGGEILDQEKGEQNSQDEEKHEG